MKKRKFLFVVFGKGMLYFIILFFMLILAFCSNQTMPAAKNALILCAENIIPSLFPFFVLSRILISTSFTQVCGKFLSPIMRILFNVSGEGAIAFIVGLISGYPMGAKTVCNLYKSQSVSKSEAERLLPFCNNSGPLFVIGAVGTGMLASPGIGLFLYCIHIASAVLTGIFTGCISRSEKNTHKQAKKTATVSFSSIFSESVKDAVNSILLVCGFVVLFSTITAPLINLLPDNNTLALVLKGVLEVTTGAQSIAQLPQAKEKLCLLSGIIGFGGICVFLQVAAIAKESNLSLKKYLQGKIFQGVAASFICNITFHKVETIDVFANNSIVNFQTGNFGATITAIFVICIFYLSILTLRKNFKKY